MTVTRTKHTTIAEGKPAVDNANLQRHLSPNCPINIVKGSLRAGLQTTARVLCSETAVARRLLLLAESVGEVLKLCLHQLGRRRPVAGQSFQQIWGSWLPIVRCIAALLSCQLGSHISGCRCCRPQQAVVAQPQRSNLSQHLSESAP